MSPLLTIFLVFLGSFILTIFAALVRHSIGQQIGSFSDLLIAAAAYETSLIADDRARSLLINSNTAKWIFDEVGVFLVPVTCVLFWISVRYGELIWIIRHGDWATKNGKATEFAIQGFVIGWLMPSAWVAVHLAAAIEGPK